MRAAVVALAFALALGSAGAAPRNPFLAAAPSAAKLVYMLTPPGFIDPATAEAFERATGLGVALDQYANAAELNERLAERRYDLLVLDGPELTRRLDRLARLDKSRLPNARYVQAGVAAKLAAYDRDGAYEVAYGWTAFGLMFDTDKLKEAPFSWTQVLGALPRPSDCGAVWPDARDETFLAAFKLIGVEATRATPTDVKAAGALIDKARANFVAFAAPDEVGALAKGAACLGAGTAGEAAAVAIRNPDAAPIRFVYPREGAPLRLYAFAMPANAVSPDAAYALLDALLDPETARRDAASAGVNAAQDDTDAAELRRLTPEPLLTPPLVAAMQAEWKRLVAGK